MAHERKLMWERKLVTTNKTCSTGRWGASGGDMYIGG